jgi:glycerol-3-phosphate dehydrogenase
MSTTTLNVSRHYELFDPYKFDTPVTIIGAGATGSFLALSLAKLGITDITVYDFDVVEEHNIPNQAFGLDDIGHAKVDALGQLIKNTTGSTINVKNEKFVSQRVAGIVFLMVDSMEIRKSIWNNSIKMKSAVKLLIEPRMGLDCARVYNVDPMDMTQIKKYEETYYGDDVAEVSACGASKSVITTAMATASWCVRQLINFVNKEELDNEILIDYKYNNIVTNRW